jgi:hypothetical protein
MHINPDLIPAGVDRISSADFRRLLAAGGPDRGRGANKYSRQVLSNLPPVKTETLQSVPGVEIQVEIPTEHDEQALLVQWLRYKEIRHSATPNGGYRSATTAKTMKAEGQAPGVPDITIWPEPRSGLPIIYIEMKRTKGGKISEYQLDWLNYLNSLADFGYPVQAHVAKGFQDARTILERVGYGGCTND